MSLATLSRRLRPRPFICLANRRFASTEVVHTEAEVHDHDQEDTIERIRNKSKLRFKHRRKMYNEPPPLGEDEKEAFSLLRLRRIYGEYGASSGINVGLLWPSKQEMEILKEKERVAYPHNVLKMMEMARRSKEEEEQKIMQRQEDLARKVAKLEDWKQEVRARVAHQEKIAREAREKKEKVLEEVRQMFGFRIDPKDERFKEALEKKELEEKKAAKAAKKLKRQQKLIENIKKMAHQKEENSNTGTDLQGTSVVPGSEPPTEPPTIPKS